jgi:hypothetical protein
MTRAGDGNGSGGGGGGDEAAPKIMASNLLHAILGGGVDQGLASGVMTICSNWIDRGGLVTL